MNFAGGKFRFLFVVALFGAVFAAAQEAPTAPPAAPPPEGEVAPAPDYSRAYYHYMLARRYRELAGIYSRGDFVERAIAEYKNAMEADPESLFLRVELAELYWRVGRIADAVRDAEAVLEVNPDQEGAHRLLANIYWRNLGEAQQDRVARQSLEKAIVHFEALARLNAEDADTHIALARLYRLSNQPEKAEEALKQVLENDPDSRNAAVNLAQLYFDQGEYQLAIELLKRVPEEEMDAPHLATLGYAYAQAHEYDEAVAAYQKALALDPENQEFRRALAEALMSDNRLAEARAELERVLKADPHDGASHLRLAQIDRQEGKFDAARKGLERAAALLPNSLDVAYQQVVLEDTLGNYDAAIEILGRLLKQSERPDGRYTVGEASNRVLFLERLGFIYRSKRDYEKSIETFRQILPLGESHAARAEGLIIETMRLNRQPERALEEAAEVVKKFPESRQMRVLYATLLGERGRVEEAVQELRGLQDGTAADREIHLSLAQIFAQGKRFEEAEAEARRALELSQRPGEEEYALFVLGSVYERSKKYEQAEATFKKVLAVNPLNAAASNYLGYMLADRGVRLEESVEYIRKALELEPNNGAYLDSLGWAYYQMERYAEAEPYLERAASLIAGDPTIQEHLGHVYLRLGKKEKARDAWERALQDWETAVTSEFDAEQAARLRKQLDELIELLARETNAARK
jgi:tetratricopeptide (TPR) repeat protein